MIIGLFVPFVILAQPYGDTEIAVFDTTFLAAPDAPPWLPPQEAPLPAWVTVQPDKVDIPLSWPAVPLKELIP